LYPPEVDSVPPVIGAAAMVVDTPLDVDPSALVTVIVTLVPADKLYTAEGTETLAVVLVTEVAEAVDPLEKLTVRVEDKKLVPVKDSVAALPDLMVPDTEDKVATLGCTVVL
jgi:molybdopterin-binding protein